MTFSRQHGIWFVFLLFLIITALFIGQQWVRGTQFFQAGTTPAITTPQEKDPILPALRPTDPRRGSRRTDAVQVVMFADYTCLYCRLTYGEVKALLDQNQVPFYLVWRDLPIETSSPESILAANAARCAADRGRFWDMHDALMSSPSVTDKSIREIAEQLQINDDTFSRCYARGTYISALQSDVSIAKELGFKGAPVLFVGHKVFDGYVNRQELLQAIKQSQP
jgi:protein-disulfide isomerase